MQSIILKIDGMTCVNCENRIEKMLKNTKGIIDTVVSYSSGTAEITYDENLIGIENIIEIIDGQGYKVVKETKEKANQRASLTKALGIAIILLSLYMIISRFGVFNVFNAFPQAEETTGYGMLFIIGLLTSLHCVAMCGGINLSQCVLQDTQKSNTLSKIAVLTPSFLYNLGRVLSYTIIGGIVGAVGSVAGFSGALKGVVQIAAGVFMVIMGLNMLNIFPWLRKFNPRMPKIFAKKINERKKSKSPLYVGLLNGLMPCGPLQAMQLYALSTGSPIKGAVSMLLFSLGTVPLMFGLGALSSFLSKKFTRKIMTVSTVLVIVLGVSMFAGGISLSGISFSAFAAEINTSARNMNVANISDNVQIVTTKLSSGSYEPITVQKGIPVKWIIKAEKKDMNGCNNEIVIPKFNIVKRLEIGDNIIEFTPTESGTFA
jgi:sulfite exporter TauE/SafE/copper chaperone CopZ